MSAFVTIFKILAMIWPFVKEMLFGKKSMSEIIRDNKLKFGILVLIVCLILFSAVAVNRIVVISNRYIELEKRYNALLGSQKTPVQHGVEVKQKVENPPLPENEKAPIDPNFTPKHLKQVPRKEDYERYNRLKKSLEDAKREEDEANRAK